MLVEVVDDDADEEVEREEGAKDDEEDKVQVHVDVHLADRLLTHLKKRGIDTCYAIQIRNIKHTKGLFTVPARRNHVISDT